MRAPSRRRDWVLWAALRCFLVVVIAGVVPWPEQTNDLNIYRSWAQGALADGRFPDDPMWQYPPLAGPVFRLGAALPGDRLGFVLLLLAFDATIMWLLTRGAGGLGGVPLDGRAGRLAQPGRTEPQRAEHEKTEPERTEPGSTEAGSTERDRTATRSIAGRSPMRGSRLWALAPVVTGPLLLARFDVVPTAFAVSAVLFLGRPGLSGALAAVGAWLKVWPVLVLAGLARRDLPQGILGVAATSALIMGALLATTTDMFGFLGEQRNRGLQIESVWAAPFLVARVLGVPVEVVYRYGAHEIDAPWAEAIASTAALASLVLLAAVGISRVAGRLEHLRGADVALATVLFSVATSRVFSGQYFIWLLGLAAVCLDDRASRMRPVVRLLVGAGLATHLIYPWLYTALLEGNPFAVLIQVIRVCLTVAAAAVAAHVIWRSRPIPARAESEA